ncbi:genetic competence negative regulator [Oceanobacillus profundus]|uniref:Genetic competence negative regulator n=1 Tax=Oceanobacillus profundus TaxID=372463 RepID=A0A417YFL5_9BACI|nr:genetic competence negative regulator [Oceanobacillus profundus]MBR3120756.1 genetic competence negative regulator [Oceanobacillus sp.]PAE29835.1 adapter protein mecA [Paenibacillus sp. 7884-2]MCM3396602.1 genetic competence negative regulator [Oceanobacillus profundus]MDO6450696.1 genetic competence negative regulator [Oceanobacillus profundus]RHW31559.1 genetic competence negative regulator [Oceanobacillus profundus]
MRIERLSNDQFTIFLTFDDLIERGFTKDDLWHDASSVRSLFSDMMYEASSELGIELEGILLVQVHLMQAQGMHIFVTQQEEDMYWDDDFIEMKVTLDESKELIFSFEEFESVIQVTSYLSPLAIEGGKVYHMDERYYMILDEDDLSDVNKEDIIGIMSEYSNPSIVTSYRLHEYGKIIFDSQAVKNIIKLFY